MLSSQGDPSRDSEGSESRHESQERSIEDFATLTPEYDRDLLAMLPSIDVIDGLISYYFEYCNWIYRHVNQASFNHHWERFKNGSSADRVVLATACALLAVATNYLPPQHQLLEGFAETHEAMSHKFFDVSSTALGRRDTKKYTLELVELLLVRTHYLTLSKNDSEDIWHVRGELVTIATAMGLHRDPGRFRLHRDVAERRRWAWWHIILLERSVYLSAKYDFLLNVKISPSWQAFMFGRPITIASHHFDTQLPSYCDPALDKSGRLYLPNIALFRLAFILGDIMDDAVSVRPIPYDSVQANDRALTQWMDNLPPELDLDEYRVARNLASSNANNRRLGVQSVIIRTSYYHIRFTLHRPYASVNSSNIKASAIDPPKPAQSLEISVSAADKLITMVGQSRPDFLANTSLAVPGHMNWGPFHCFSAAMFFSFQLIANPDQPGASLFRASISKAIHTLEQSRGNSVADKAYDILQALAPLYSIDFPQQSSDARDKERARILSVVRKLAFPYHDSHDPRRFGESPSTRGAASSPANSNSVSPPLGTMSNLPHQYDSLPGHAMSSLRTATTLYPHSQLSGSMQPMTQSPHSQVHLSPTIMAQPPAVVPTSSPTYPASQTYGMSQQQQLYPDHSRYTQYAHPVDEAMWGAAVGFEQGEWTQFLDGLRADTSSNSNRHHLQGS